MKSQKSVSVELGFYEGKKKSKRLCHMILWRKIDLGMGIRYIKVQVLQF